MIVFIAMAIVVAFTAGFAACALMVAAGDADRRHVDDLARRDRIR